MEEEERGRREGGLEGEEEERYVEKMKEEEG